MSELTIIHDPLHSHDDHGHHSHIRVPVDRLTLSKRRWRGVAEDGREFGFDLESPLHNGSHFFAVGKAHYVIDQTPETVLEIIITTPDQAAQLAWNLGNLHFGIEVLPDSIRVTPDPAVLNFLTREGILFKKGTCVFEPLSAGAHHHHHDHSDHHHG